MLESFEQRVAEVNREVAGWQDRHVRLWSAFGPALGSAGKGTGMGGAVAVLPLVFASEGPALPQQIAFLASTVSESGQSLRALGRFVERTRSVLHVDAVPLAGPRSAELPVRSAAVALDGRASSSTAASTSAPAAALRCTRRPPAACSSRGPAASTGTSSSSTTVTSCARCTATCRRPA